jgi:hypothetical protein
VIPPEIGLQGRTISCFFKGQLDYLETQHIADGMEMLVLDGGFEVAASLIVMNSAARAAF